MRWPAMRWTIEHAAGHPMMVRRWGSDPAEGSEEHAEEGSGEGSEEIVWIHGLGEQSENLVPAAAHPALAGFSHTLIDLPGYGRSPWPDAPDDLAVLAARIASWIGDRRPVVIGHSMGGVLATLVAELTAVRAVIDVDGNLSRGDCNFSGQAAALSRDDFVTHGMAALRAQIYDAGRDDLAQRGYHAALMLACPAVFHHQACQLVALSESETLAARLAALRAPALFIAGVPDGVCARSRELLDRHGVRWIGIAPAGHAVHLDQPDRFATDVAGFLAGQ